MTLAQYLLLRKRVREIGRLPPIGLEEWEMEVAIKDMTRANEAARTRIDPLVVEIVAGFDSQASDQIHISTLARTIWDVTLASYDLRKTLKLILLDLGWEVDKRMVVATRKYR